MNANVFFRALRQVRGRHWASHMRMANVRDSLLAFRLSFLRAVFFAFRGNNAKGC
jgi:hypothetical protein